MPDHAEGLFTLRQMASAHARLDGRDPEEVHAQFRGFRNAGLIPETVAGNGKTGANMYNIETFARVRLVSPIFTSFGVSTGALKKVLDEIRAEEIDVLPDGTHINSGIVAALSGIRRGEDWTLGITILQNTETGDTNFSAKLAPTMWLSDPTTPGNKREYLYMPPLELRCFIKIPASELLRPLLLQAEDRPHRPPKRAPDLENRLQAREAEITELLAGRAPDELIGGERLIWAALRRSRGMLLYQISNQD